MYCLKKTLNVRFSTYLKLFTPAFLKLDVPVEFHTDTLEHPLQGPNFQFSATLKEDSEDLSIFWKELSKSTDPFADKLTLPTYVELPISEVFMAAEVKTMILLGFFCYDSNTLAQTC